MRVDLFVVVVWCFSRPQAWELHPMTLSRTATNAVGCCPWYFTLLLIFWPKKYKRAGKKCSIPLRNKERIGYKWICFSAYLVNIILRKGVHLWKTRTYINVYIYIYNFRVLYMNIFGLTMLISLLFLCGMGVFAVYAGCDPLNLGFVEKKDQLLPYFVMDQLRSIIGLPGLFVACLFCGTLR